jgi:hypothetical protein
MEYSLDEVQQDRLVGIVVRGMERGEPDETVRALADSGLVLVKGPMTMPTPAGTEWVGNRLRLAEDAPERERIMATFRRFLPINRQLRDLCTSWQVRPDGSSNDHSDEGYDAQIRDRLDDIDEAITPLLTRFSQDIPRIDAYRGRLTVALDHLDDGDNAWLASPLIDSYHTVWMHLHQELLLTIGLSRQEDEALEERLVSGEEA